MPKFSVLKVRDAKLEELAPKRKIRAVTPRQMAIQARDREIDILLNEVSVGSESTIKAVELPDGAKVQTFRAIFKKRIKGSGLPVNMGIRNRTVYLSRGRLPGGRSSSEALGR